MPPQSLSPRTAKCVGWCSFGHDLTAQVMVSKGLITSMMQLLIGSRKNISFYRIPLFKMLKDRILRIWIKLEYRKLIKIEITEIPHKKLPKTTLPLNVPLYLLPGTVQFLTVIRLLYSSYFLSNLINVLWISPRSNKKSKTSTSMIRELFLLFKV